MHNKRSYGEENPLEHYAIIIWFGLRVEPKLIFLVVVLGEVEKNGGSLEHGEVIPRLVNYYGNTAVRVEFDEPWLLCIICQSIAVKDEGNALFARSWINRS